MSKVPAQLSYSSEVVRAFRTLSDVEEPFAQSPRNDARVLAAVAHEELARLAPNSDDTSAGLRAARQTSVGEFGVFDYLSGTAETVSSALQSTQRFASLVCDTLTISVEVDQERCLVRLELPVDFPQPAFDFLFGWFYLNHLCRLFHEKREAIDVWIPDMRPEQLSEYHATFAPSSLRFVAPCAGFAFHERHLNRPLEMADPKLHAILLEYASDKLQNLPGTTTVTSRVRQLLRASLRSGEASLGYVAKRLDLSTRTLSRRLEDEGTRYAELVDEARRELALKYVEEQLLPLHQIAKHLRFAHQTSFHRAFRRWTGATPLEFRRQCRRRDAASLRGGDAALTKALRRAE